nr:MAG TPA: hypothetical protein [Herelleviridae sp.]
MVIVEERALPVFAGTATVTSCDPPPRVWGDCHEIFLHNLLN